MGGYFLKLLYVEDAKEQAAVVLAFLTLSQEEVETTHVETLRDCIKELKSEPYDVVLLDLGLPDGSGVELVQQIDQTTTATPIVVLTGNEETGLGARCIEAGAQEFLNKLNLNPQRLLDCLTHAIIRKREMAPALSRVLQRFKNLHQSDIGTLDEKYVERYLALLSKPKELFTVKHWDLGRALAQDGVSSEQLLAMHETCLRTLCEKIPHAERSKYLERSDMMALATIAFMSDTYRDLSLKATTKALADKVKRRKK